MAVPCLAPLCHRLGHALQHCHRDVPIPQITGLLHDWCPPGFLWTHQRVQDVPRSVAYRNIWIASTTAGFCNVGWADKWVVKYLEGTVPRNLINLQRDTECRRHAVAQLVEALRYKPEGRGFDSWWCPRSFSLTWSSRPYYGPGAASASNRNEFQEYFLGDIGGITTLMCLNLLESS